jgi:hypothetical protein
VSRIFSTSFLAFALAASLVSPARAELAAWDQAKVTALAGQLAEAASSLYSTLCKQGPPQLGSGQASDYRELKQEVRRIQSEAKELAGALGKGEGREDTLDIYENLMEIVRDARENAQRVFSTKAVQDEASKVRQILNQISPYYDADSGAAPARHTLRAGLAHPGSGS